MYINEMPRFYGAKNIARRNGGISFNTYVPDELRYLPHDSDEPKNVSHSSPMNNGDALETSATNNTSYVDYDYDQNSKYNATHASNNEMREKLSFKEKVVKFDARNSNPIHNNAYLD